MFKRILFAVLSAAVIAGYSVAGYADSRPGPVESIEVSSAVLPFESHGDLWFSTWADENTVFMSWGDGLGPYYSTQGEFSHNGLMRVSGAFPDVSAEVVQRFMPLSDDVNNSKPTSMLFINGRLYVAIHSPLLTPEMGFIAYSDDYGKNFSYDTDTDRRLGLNSNFICLMFINMGMNYELAQDEYVYAFGAPGEINSTGKIYLVRMKADEILDETKWSYFAGKKKGEPPVWSDDYADAKKVSGLSSQSYTSLYPDLLFSAAYHPGSDRYFVITANTMDGRLYEALHPWGPWRHAANWFEGEDSEWFASYMPGIITKDMGPDSFYFTAAGRTDFEPLPGDFKYALKIGKITMKFKDVKLKD